MLNSSTCCAAAHQDNNPSFGGMEYTGTRFYTTTVGNVTNLTGSPGGFVSYGLSSTSPDGVKGSNSGSFCTSSSVIGTGAYLNPQGSTPAVSGSYANFWVSAPGVLTWQSMHSLPLIPM